MAKAVSGSSRRVSKDSHSACASCGLSVNAKIFNSTAGVSPDVGGADRHHHLKICRGDASSSLANKSCKYVKGSVYKLLVITRGSE